VKLIIKFLDNLPDVSQLADTGEVTLNLSLPSGGPKGREQTPNQPCRLMVVHDSGQPVSNRDIFLVVGQQGGLRLLNLPEDD
jgi:hypothetical protein